MNNEITVHAVQLRFKSLQIEFMIWGVLSMIGLLFLGVTEECTLRIGCALLTGIFIGGCLHCGQEWYKVNKWLKQI